MATASPYAPSETSSTETVRPTPLQKQRNLANDNPERTTYIEDNRPAEDTVHLLHSNRAANGSNNRWNILSSRSPSPTFNNAIQAISIEIVIISLFNRARIRLLCGDTECADIFVYKALYYLNRFPDPDLKALVDIRKRNYDRVRHFRLPERRFSDPGFGPVAELDSETLNLILRRCSLEHTSLWERLNSDVRPPRQTAPPESDADDSAVDSIAGEPATPVANDVPESGDLPTGEVGRFFEEIKNAPPRRRRSGTRLGQGELLQRNHGTGTVNPSALSEIADQDISLFTPSGALTAETIPMNRANRALLPRKLLGQPSESNLNLRRRLRHQLSAQAHAAPPKLSHERSGSSSADTRLTTIGPLPQRRPSLDCNLQNVADDSEALTLLSTDTPSLTKLATLKDPNPTSHSGSASSATTAILRRLSQSSGHDPPPLSVQTSAQAANSVSALDSTVPIYHSPLRATFGPDPDDIGSTSVEATSSSNFDAPTDPYASDKIPNVENRERPDDSSDSLTHENPDETMTARDRLDAERVVHSFIEQLVDEIVSDVSNAKKLQQQQTRASNYTQKQKQKQKQRQEDAHQRPQPAPEPFQSQLGTFFAAAGIQPSWRPAPAPSPASKEGPSRTPEDLSSPEEESASDREEWQRREQRLQFLEQAARSLRERINWMAGRADRVGRRQQEEEDGEEDLEEEDDLDGRGGG